MDAALWQRIESLFARALEVPASDRLAFVAAECGGNDDLRSEVASLLENALGNTKLEEIVADAVRSEKTSLAGQLIGDRFLVECEVGAGGMGTVYRAIDRTQAAVLAVKVLPAPFGDGEQQRFDREARVLAGLDHPGIVRYVAHGFDPRHGPFLAMEWLDGEDLSTRLARSPLSVADSLRVARDVALALSHAHARGVVHRDIKPSNIWIARGDPQVVKVLDFGIARARGAASLTGTNAIIGTVGYMAPEQARGERTVDRKADLFSLGCVLYECLTGTRAFDGDHVVAVLVKLLHDEPSPLSTARPDLPPELDDLLTCLLDKDPALRPADAATVAQVIQKLGAVDAPSPKPDQRIDREPRLSSGEQRILQLLLVDPCTETASDQTLVQASADRGITAIQGVTAAYGAAVTPLRNGMVLVAVPERGSARDRAEAGGAIGLAIQGAMMNARIAIASGRGDPGRRLPGSVIDRCAAVLDAIGPGQIGIDDTTARLVEERFVVHEGSRCALLVGERKAPDEDRLLLGKPMPCIGRTKELALLAAIVEESLDDSVARSVLVTATAGAGKSRLAHELMRRSGARTGLRVVGVRGDPVEAGSNLAMLKQLVRRVAGIEDADDTRGCERALHTILDGAAPDPDRACELLVSEVLGRPILHPRTPELQAARNDASERAAWIERSVIDLLDACSRSGPLVLLLDDLHWAGAATIAYVGETLRALHDRPLFVFALGRPEVDALFVKPWPTLQRIALEPLGRRAATELVRRALPPSVDDTAIAAIVERAQGNAFYLEELVRAFAADRHELPETVQAMVEVRLHHEPAEARHVLRCASVFGERCSMAAVAALTDRTSGELRRSLAGLVDSELLDRDRDDKDAFLFRHAIVREVAYAMVPASDRVELHRRAASWLEQYGETDPLVLAGHHERAGNQAAFAECLTRATEQAYGLNQLERAVSIAERALSLEALTDVQRGRADICRCGSLLHVGRVAEALGVAMGIARYCAPRSDPWIRALAIQSMLLWCLGKPDDAIRSARPLANETFDAADTAGQSLWAMALAVVLIGDQDAARAITDSLVRTLASTTDPLVAAYAHGATAMTALSTFGDVGRALELAEQGDAMLVHVASAQASGWHDWWRGWVFWTCGQDERALAITERLQREPAWRDLKMIQLSTFGLIGTIGRLHPHAAAAAAAAAALPGMHDFMIGAEANARFAAGDFAEAERLARLAWDGQRGTWTAPGAATLLARLALARGETDRALELVQQAVDMTIARTCPLRLTAGAWLCLVEVHAARGDHEAATQLRATARIRLLDIANGIAEPARAIFLAAHPYAQLVGR